MAKKPTEQIRVSRKRGLRGFKFGPASKVRRITDPKKKQAIAEDLKDRGLI